MSKIKLNLESGQVQERELITAFKCNDVKYIIFDGESIGSMGLPIILVSKEMLGRCVGITEAEEWAKTKECLEKIISGGDIEYARVPSELKSDNVYYRQLTLPIVSFDLLKNSYKEPEEEKPISTESDTIPVYDAINSIDSNPVVAPDGFYQETPIYSANNTNAELYTPDTTNQNDIQVESSVDAFSNSQNNVNYNSLKADFMKAAEEFFDKIYDAINH